MFELGIKLKRTKITAGQDERMRRRLQEALNGRGDSEDEEKAERRLFGIVEVGRKKTELRKHCRCCP
jgi:hypothetical protein